ncbi:MAG: DUF1592 domain-containing protein [Planctomycetales bacterium]|nr:DUF1592 domain-containing protein [Planctomycetales bacterium]
MTLAIATTIAKRGNAQLNPEGDASVTIDDNFFTRTLYPLLQAAECNLCHNDNGVATDTDLQFPETSANPDRVEAFGYQMLSLVNSEHPRESLLFLKPTNRVEHEGEERIKRGSPAESALLAWIDYLASLSEDEIERARARIEQAQQASVGRLQVRRLSHSQFNNAVHDLLQDQTLPANRFPKEDFVRGFKNQSEGQSISPLQAESYSKAAERLAIAAFRGGDWLGLYPLNPMSTDDRQAASAFVSSFGTKVFRRPLSDEEVAQYTELFIADAKSKDDVLAGGRIVVEAMLQSPHFLFRIERGPDSPYRQYELASRLAFFLWDTTPDDQLLQAARDGRLATRQQVAEIARSMLADPRATKSLEEFLAQWLRFDQVLEATRDRQFRQFNSEVAAAMVEETTRLFNYLVWQNHNFMEFFTANYTFLNSDLANLYGFPPPPEEFSRVDYPPDSGRAGVLGHGSFLVATSKPAETSPTERGLFIRNKILSQEVPAPPPGVSATLPEITEERPMTNRQRLNVHLNSDACSSCHRLIDPIGFGFEQYNPIGAFSEKMVVRIEGQEDALQLALDTSAQVQGIDNSQFSTPKQLGIILASSEVCQKAVVKQLFRFAFGRQETVDDEQVIERLLRDFQASEFRFQELIMSLVTSDLFLQDAKD